MSVEIIREKRERLAQQLPLQGPPDSPSMKYYTNLKEEEILPLYRTRRSTCAGMQTRYTLHNGSPCRYLGNDRFHYSSIIEHIDEIDKNLFFPESNSKLEILNQAKFNDGMYMKIPGNYASDKLTEIMLTNESDYVARHYVEIGENSQVNFIVNYIESSGTTVSNSAIINVGDNSILGLYLLEDSSLSKFNHLNLKIKLGRYASVKIFHLSVFGPKDITKIDLAHESQFTDSNYLGSAIGKKNNHLDLEVFSDHMAPNEHNNIIFKGILGNSSSMIFRGNIRIGEESKSTESFLMANLLLLSKEAKGNAIPTLEIYNGNVRSKHGETVSNIPEEQVQYLMSRGIETKEAKRLILEGFINPIIDPIPEEIREKYLRMVDEIVD